MESHAEAVEGAGLKPVTRRIGLSLGADICWPLCYEQIMAQLDLAIPWGGEEVRLEVERVPITPFSLDEPCPYAMVLDRLTHWYMVRREWIKKSIIMDGLYVLNNPWAVQSMEKHTTYAAMMRLGLPIPKTWMIPPKSYEQVPDLRVTLHRYAKLFDLSAVGEEVGYPLVMKPYDGGGWRGVSFIRDRAALKQRYDESGTQVMHLQQAVHPYDRFVRCIGLGPQTHLVNYNPDAPLHDRYTLEQGFASEEDAAVMRETTLTINAFFGWDFNSCEALRKDGVWHPIDFANPCPDSQVTSLHYHFPWMVIANLRWSIFCAVTRRAMKPNQDWAPYFAIADDASLSQREKLKAYAALAEAHFDSAAFEAFCAEHLPHLERVAWEFFGTEAAKDAFRQKVAALYPAHEVEPFTELFWRRVQAWRADNTPQEAA